MINTVQRDSSFSHGGILCYVATNWSWKKDSETEGTHINFVFSENWGKYCILIQNPNDKASLTFNCLPSLLEDEERPRFINIHQQLDPVTFHPSTYVYLCLNCQWRKGKAVPIGHHQLTMIFCESRGKYIIVCIDNQLIIFKFVYISIAGKRERK